MDFSRAHGLAAALVGSEKRSEVSLASLYTWPNQAEPDMQIHGNAGVDELPRQKWKHSIKKNIIYNLLYKQTSCIKEGQSIIIKS